MTTKKQNPPAGNRGAQEDLGGSGSQSTSARSSAPRRYEETLVADCTAEYLATIADEPDKPLSEIRDELLDQLRFHVSLASVGLGLKGNDRFRLPRTLDEITVVRVLLARRTIRRIDLSGGKVVDMELLGLYRESGPDAGIYVSRESVFEQLISELAPAFTSRQIASAYKRLRSEAEVVARTQLPHLSPVANGIYDWDAQELLPFDPDLIYLSKISVPYDPTATSPRIMTPHGDEWEVEEWMRTLAVDPAVVQLLWEVISACVRPWVQWDCTAWLMSARGNNGKGTLVRLIRNLLGDAACASVPIARFGSQFATEPLTWAIANLVDENDVGDFAKSVGRYKAALTGDTFDMDRKYKTPLAFQWKGFDVQCFNEEVPRVKDRSKSFLRRLRMIPFHHTFTGVERKYIKHDYLGRDDVLRYVLKRVLHMRNTEVSEPDMCLQMKEEWVEGNNPVVGFWVEHRDGFAWDLLPFPFLYEMYQSWFSRTNPSGTAESRPTFIRSLRSVVSDDPDWSDHDNKPMRVGSRMDSPEHMIATYELRSWYNPAYSYKPGTLPDLDKLCSPLLNVSYRGLVRIVPSRPSAAPISSLTLPPSLDIEFAEGPDA